MKPVILISFLLAFIAAPVYTHAQTGLDPIYTFAVSLWPKGDNSPRSPRKKTQDTTLQAAIADAVKTGKLQAYADAGFAQPLSIANATRLIKMESYIDTLIYAEANGDEYQSLIGVPFDFYAITDYRILARGTTSMQLIGVGIERRREKIAEKAKKYNVADYSVTVPVFWCKYRDIKPLFDQYNATHPDNKFIARRG